MTDSHLANAFFEVCRDARPSVNHYVSLYCKSQYYGGSEEGGWWGTDVHLVAYMQFPTTEAAEAALAQVADLAAQLGREELESYGEYCKRTCEWLESRGLDPDFLPEVDGEDSYYATIEDIPGASERRGCRHYE